MSFNIAYLVVTCLLLLVALLYFSPYELNVEDEAEED